MERVSSGSDSFYLYVEDGNGNVNYTTVSKSGTITINDLMVLIRQASGKYGLLQKEQFQHPLKQ